MIDKMVHYADILAIVFFFYGIIYFYKIRNKNLGEWILFLFCITGFIMDTIFTINYFNPF